MDTTKEAGIDTVWSSEERYLTHDTALSDLASPKSDKMPYVQ